MKKVNVPSLVKTFTTLEWKKVKKKMEDDQYPGIKGMSLKEFKKFMTADIEDKESVVDDTIWPFDFLRETLH
tara:strand:- start:449 stop:664 length:216 start_codon:yes stop_codon:yes gene_type:complete